MESLLQHAGVQMLLEIGSGEVAAKVSLPAVQLLCTLEDKAASSRKNRLKRQLVRFKSDIRKASLTGSVVALKNTEKVHKSLQSRFKHSLPGWLYFDSGPSQMHHKQQRGSHGVVLEQHTHS